jgi:hypothetical protein
LQEHINPVLEQIYKIYLIEKGGLFIF